MSVFSKFVSVLEELLKESSDLTSNFFFTSCFFRRIPGFTRKVLGNPVTKALYSWWTKNKKILKPGISKITKPGTETETETSWKVPGCGRNISVGLSPSYIMEILYDCFRRIFPKYQRSTKPTECLLRKIALSCVWTFW